MIGHDRPRPGVEKNNGGRSALLAEERRSPVFTAIGLEAYGNLKPHDTNQTTMGPILENVTMTTLLHLSRAVLAAFSPGKRLISLVATVPLALLFTLASFGFATPAKAQSDFYDVGDIVCIAELLPTVTNGAGGAGLFFYDQNSYFGFEMLSISSATEMTINVYVDNTLVVSNEVVNTGSGVWSNTYSYNSVSYFLAFGTSGANTITVPTGQAVAIVFGFAGIDAISLPATTSSTALLAFGGAGDDIIIGGAGIDFVFGDWVDGGASASGNDTIQTHDHADFIHGGPGNDTMIAGPQTVNYPNWLYGGDGNDTMTGSSGIDFMYGEDGMDDMFGNEDNDEMYGGDNDDLMMGGDDDDYMEGNEGDDCLDGGTGEDDLYGGSGRDFLHDNDGASSDYLNGGSEEDQIWSISVPSQSAADTIDGGASSDSAWFETTGTADNSPTNVESSNPATPSGYSGSFLDYASWSFTTSMSISTDDFWGSSGHAGPRN